MIRRTLPICILILLVASLSLIAFSETFFPPILDQKTKPTFIQKTHTSSSHTETAPQRTYSSSIALEQSNVSTTACVPTFGEEGETKEVKFFSDGWTLFFSNCSEHTCNYSSSTNTKNDLLVPNRFEAGGFLTLNKKDIFCKDR